MIFPALVSKEVEVATVEEPGGEKNASFVIVATFLPLKSFWNIVSFLRLSGRVEAQLRRGPGVIRYALRTNLPHKQFWTLSVWTNGEDMARFSKSEPHRTAMKKFYEWGTESAAIAEWTSPESKLDWKEAEKRLKTPMFRYRLAGNRLVHDAGSKVVLPQSGESQSDESRQ